ncbi:hypothetical protein QYE76_002018 [Lolium multiflorum]|uniref:DUF6598 domain-containing protein n=1 Tax=Lolium multiflorum TaxID=4521 RepID=A0AAD8RKV3_LOLMU|nr:hypothetical protein QYE76_002018 [Lolium multiflorum]
MGEMETCAGHKRLPAEGHQETVNDQSKRPRDNDDEEEREMLAELAEWRDNWAGTWSDYYGSVDKRTQVGPVQFTMGPVPSYPRLESALQIFSVKVVELKGTMTCWPIDVYGFIAVRDSVDRNRNYIFERARSNYQTLTEQDTTLVLNGPSRAVQLIDPVMFEVELRVKGTRPSEDKLLSGEFFDYNCIIRYRVGSLLEEMVSGPRSTLQFKYAHLRLALEAQIKVWFAEGSTDFSVKFVARTASIDENATLLECKDVATALSDDGSIDLSRNVLVVEGNNGVLIVGAQVKQQGDDEEAGIIYREVSFTAATYGESHGTLDVGFCKMNVVVAWSLLF